MERLFSGESFLFGNPIENFFKELKLGHFTKTYQKQQMLQSHLNDLQMLEHYKAIREKFEPN